MAALAKILAGEEDEPATLPPNVPVSARVKGAAAAARGKKTGLPHAPGELLRGEKVHPARDRGVKRSGFDPLHGLQDGVKR